VTITTNDLIEIVRNRGRGDPPTAMGETIIVPTVTVMQYLDAKIQFARLEQNPDAVVATLEDDAALTDWATRLNETVETVTNRLRQDVDDLASNFGLLRRPAAQSQGTVIIFRSSTLTTPITLPSGFKFFSP